VAWRDGKQCVCDPDRSQHPALSCAINHAEFSVLVKLEDRIREMSDEYDRKVVERTEVKEFCSRNCKEKWRYHHIVKPRRSKKFT
jgi:hypothetical protein